MLPIKLIILQLSCFLQLALESPKLSRNSLKVKLARECDPLVS